MYLELWSGTGDTKTNTNSLVFQGFMLSQRTESYPGGSEVRNLPAMQETWVPSLSQEDPLEEGMATHSSILGWRIPWTEEAGRLQSMGLQRVGHGWATNTFKGQRGVPGLLYNVCAMLLVWMKCRDGNSAFCQDFAWLRDRILLD